MTLKVNGEQYETQRESLKSLLKELNIVPERVAVEVNLKVIKRADFDKYKLQEGDNIEIVYFVGGGQKAVNSQKSKAKTNDQTRRKNGR